MYERPGVNVKVERGSTFKFTRERPCIVAILFTRVKITRQWKSTFTRNPYYLRAWSRPVGLCTKNMFLFCLLTALFDEAKQEKWMRTPDEDVLINVS